MSCLWIPRQFRRSSTPCGSTGPSLLQSRNSIPSPRSRPARTKPGPLRARSSDWCASLRRRGQLCKVRGPQGRAGAKGVVAPSRARGGLSSAPTCAVRTTRICMQQATGRHERIRLHAFLCNWDVRQHGVPASRHSLQTATRQQKPTPHTHLTPQHTTRTPPTPQERPPHRRPLALAAPA